MLKKAQTSIEFVILFSLVMLLFLAGLYFTGQKLVEIEEKRIQTNSNAINNILQSEIALASKSEGNYSRLFTMPTLFRNDNYSINIYDNFELVVYYNGREYVYPLEQNIIYFDVHPGSDNLVSHINNTVFIGDDTTITVHPANTQLGIPEGSTITISATVASILGGISSVLRFLSEPDCDLGPPNNICSDLIATGQEYINMTQTDFINFSTDIIIKDFGRYTFTINGTSILNAPSGEGLISPIEDHGEPFYFLDLLNLPPTYGSEIEPANNSVYIQPKNFAPVFSATFYDSNNDLEDVYLDFISSPIGPYIVDPIPDVPSLYNATGGLDPLPPVNYEFPFEMDLPLADFGFYTFTFRVEDSQGVAINTPLRTVELKNVDPVVDEVNEKLTASDPVSLIEMTSWSGELNFDTFSVEVHASDINWNLKNITLVFTDMIGLDSATNLKNIVVNNSALDSDSDGVHNPNGGWFSAVFDSSNGLIFDAYGQFFFKFVATDILGLTHESGVYQVNAYPPPHFDESSIKPPDGTLFDFWEGFETDFNVTFSDDFEGGYDYGLLESVNLDFTKKPDDSGITGHIEMLDPSVSEYIFSVKKALDKFGEYNYRFSGINIFEGINTTDVITASLINTPPEIQGAYNFNTMDEGNQPIVSFDHGTTFRIPYDPLRLYPDTSVDDIFYLYVIDNNRNLDKVSLIFKEFPLGVIGTTLDFTVPQVGSSIYWADFRDFLFPKFGEYLFYFEAEDEKGLKDISADYSLFVKNLFPEFYPIHCPSGICAGASLDLPLITTPNPTILSTTQDYNFGFQVSGSDLNWNLDYATVRFTSSDPFHDDLMYSFVANQGPGYTSEGTYDFNIVFDSDSTSDPTDYGTYTFKVDLVDDENLITTSQEYTLNLENEAPAFGTICPVSSWDLSGCIDWGLAFTGPLYIWDNLNIDDEIYNLPFLITVYDVNHNLFKLKIKISFSADNNDFPSETSALGGTVYEDVFSPSNSRVNDGWSFDLDAIGTYTVEFWAYDEEGAYLYHVFEVMIGNPFPEFYPASMQPVDGHVMQWGDGFTFLATAYDSASDLDYIDLIFTNYVGSNTVTLNELNKRETAAGYVETLAFSEYVDFVDFAFGVYTYHFEAVDSADQTTVSPDRTLIVSNDDPTINSVSWSPDTAGDVSLSWATEATIIIDDVNQNVNEIWISGDGSSTTNYDDIINQLSGEVKITVTFDSFGTKTVQINAKDTEGATVQSGDRTFSLTNSAPTLSAGSPNNKILVASIATYPFTVTAGDSNNNLANVTRGIISGPSSYTIPAHTDTDASGGSYGYDTPATIGGGFGSYSYSYSVLDGSGVGASSPSLSFDYVSDYPIIGVDCTDFEEGGSDTFDVVGSSHNCYVWGTDDYSFSGTAPYYGISHNDAKTAIWDLIYTQLPSGSAIHTESFTDTQATYVFTIPVGDVCDEIKFKFRTEDSNGFEHFSGEFSIHLEQPEICDGKDNDCNGVTDEGCDDDDDGYCDDSMICAGSTLNCDAGVCTDCDDGDGNINPDAPEICNMPGEDSDIDDNCDGSSDEGEGLGACITYYMDNDNDRYIISSDSKCYCDAQGDYTEDEDSSFGDDCCDSGSAYDYWVNPGQTSYRTYSHGCPNIPDYDWNCDGTDEKQYTGHDSNSCEYSGGCISTPFWKASSDPACGVEDKQVQWCNQKTAKCAYDKWWITQPCR